MEISNVSAEISKAYRDQDEMEWVAKRSRTWSEEELGRRKNLQGGISAAGSTAGLASLGLLGASVAAKKKPVLVKVTPAKLKDASLTSGIIASGIGGIGGLHFGSVQRQEVRRQKINAAKLNQVSKALVDYDKRRRRGEALQAAGWAGMAGGAGATYAGVRGTNRSMNQIADQANGVLREVKVSRRPNVDVAGAAAKAKSKVGVKPGKKVAKPGGGYRGGSYYKIISDANPLRTSGRYGTLTGAGVGAGALGAGTALGGWTAASEAKARKKRQQRLISKKMTKKDKEYAREAATSGTGALLGAGIAGAAAKGRAREVLAQKVSQKKRVMPQRMGAGPKSMRPVDMATYGLKSRWRGTALYGGAVTAGALGTNAAYNAARVNTYQQKRR